MSGIGVQFQVVGDMNVIFRSKGGGFQTRPYMEQSSQQGTGVWIPAPRFHGDKLCGNDGLSAVKPPELKGYYVRK